MSEKRFVQLGDTSIKDTLTGEEWYAPCETSLLKLLNEQQDTITKLEQICETKMQEIEDIKYGLKEIAYKYRKEVQFKADTDPNQAVKEVLCEQQAEIERLEKIIALTNYQLKVQDRTINELEKNIQDLEKMLNKIPKSIKELWIE